MLTLRFLRVSYPDSGIPALAGIQPSTEYQVPSTRTLLRSLACSAVPRYLGAAAGQDLYAQEGFPSAEIPLLTPGIPGKFSVLR